MWIFVGTHTLGTFWGPVCSVAGFALKSVEKLRIACGSKQG